MNQGKLLIGNKLLKKIDKEEKSLFIKIGILMGLLKELKLWGKAFIYIFLIIFLFNFYIKKII
jgi:hypothetical protein